MKLAALNAMQARRREQLARPRLADGVELLGEYAGSGFKEPPYLVRRADGQVLQLSRLAYTVAEACDGRTDVDEIARRTTESLGRGLTAEHVVFLVEQKLRPVGVVSADVPTELPREHGVLALRVRTAVIPPRVVQAAGLLLTPLFAPFAIGAVVAWLLVLDVWLFFHGGLHGLAHDLLARPVLLLAVLGLALVGTVLHECGHAAACRYGGARPGAMGVGVYLVWPAFYTDVTDAYRLDRRGRLRTDLGGVYLNAVFAVSLGALYLQTGFRPLIAAAALQHVQIVQQLVPWGRLDGYYVITDLTGVPDILARVKPILRSLVPGAPPEPRVTQLKPWVRAVVTAYVLTLVPVVVLVYVLFALNLPRYVPAVAHALAAQLHAVRLAVQAESVTALALAVIQALVLALPAVAITLLLLGLVRRIGAVCWRRLVLRPRLLAAAVFVVGVAVASAAFVAWTSPAEFGSASAASARHARHRAHRGSRPTRSETRVPTARPLRAWPPAPFSRRRPARLQTRVDSARVDSSPAHAATGTGAAARHTRPATTATTAKEPTTSATKTKPTTSDTTPTTVTTTSTTSTTAPTDTTTTTSTTDTTPTTTTTPTTSTPTTTTNP